MQQKGDKKLGEFIHTESGINVVYFIRHTRFVCTVLEEELSAPEASVLREQVMDRLNHWLHLEWWPVIEIESDAQDRHSYRDETEGVEFNLSTKRYYLSRSPASTRAGLEEVRKIGGGKGAALRLIEGKAK